MPEPEIWGSSAETNFFCYVRVLLIVALIKCWLRQTQRIWCPPILVGLVTVADVGAKAPSGMRGGIVGKQNFLGFLSDLVKSPGPLRLSVQCEIHIYSHLSS